MEVYWLEQSGAGVPFGDVWFSVGERARFAALRIPKRRSDWRLGRWTAKCAISLYLNLPRDPDALAAIELLPAPSGAPTVFIHGRPAPVALSLSHSRDAGFCAIAPEGAAVGCDVETVEPRSLAFLADYFTDAERELVAQTPVSRRDGVLTLLWSAKESTLKALRRGLQLDTRSVNVAPAAILPEPQQQWHPVSAAHASGKVFYGWWREAGNLVRTVVADPPPLRLVALRQDGAGS